MTVLTIAELIDRRGDLLALDLVAGEAGLDRQITGADISSPGLVLAGFIERFPLTRSQVLGETEIMYLRSLDGDRRAEILRRFLENDLPCVIVTKGLELPSELISHLEKIPFLKGLPSPKLVSCELPVIPLTPYATVCRRTRATSTCTPSLPFCVSLLACE